MHRISAALAACFLLLSLKASAQDSPVAGDRIELKARHHAGVPLHPQPQAGDQFDRVPDGARVTVRAVHPPNGWLNLQVDDGRSGWISPRYVGRILGGSTPGSDPDSEQAARVWGSSDGCEEVLGAGGRLRWDLPDEESLRVATWNIRWFSRGCPASEDCPENATDLDWLACSIAWTEVDLLALNEILDTGDARTALGLLRQRLDQLTGGSWEVDLSACGGPSAQHVGFLWNTARLALAGQADSCDLNGVSPGGECADPCAGNLRPGRYARATSTRAGGVDFHVAAVHLDSGTSNRDFQNRRTTVQRIPDLAVAGEPLLATDQDVLVLGDFNTMGRLEPPEVSASLELDLFDQELGTGFRRVVTALPCSEYFQGEGGLLDHVVVTAGMAEAAIEARIGGYCGVLECRPFAASAPAAYERLSDHCPVLFELRDQDLD